MKLITTISRFPALTVENIREYIRSSLCETQQIEINEENEGEQMFINPKDIKEDCDYQKPERILCVFSFDSGDQSTFRLVISDVSLAQQYLDTGKVRLFEYTPTGLKEVLKLQNIAEDTVYA